MSRLWVGRLLLGIISLLILLALWGIVYEVVVGIRWKASMQAEGASRWALLQSQNANKTITSLWIPWNHFYSRVFYPPTQTETLIRAFISLGSIFALFLFAFFVKTITKKPMPYGSAKVGTLADATKKKLTRNKGLVLGYLNGATITSDDPSHVLVVGPTRSGKGVSFIIPNGYTWVGSSVWFDPKQENFEAFGGYRQALGNKVYMFAPGQERSHRYNPLDFISRGPQMPTDCLVVASFIVPESSGEIWGKAARVLLSAMIGYVITSPTCEAGRHLRAVSRLTTTDKNFGLLLLELVKTEKNVLPSWVINGFNQFIALEDETRTSALFNITTPLSAWNNDLVAAATETSDFDPRELRKRPTSIFIGCSVAQIDVYRPIVNILVQQIHDLLMSKKPGADEPYQCLMMIDEFRQLGRMPDLISKLSISAGYGFRMVLVLTDVSQLDELYGKATRITTLSACQVKLFIRINDVATSDMVSELMGNTTVEIRTPIIRPGQGIFSSRDKNVQYQERPLRSSYDLRQMDESIAVAFVPNAPPFELTKITYYKDQPYRKIHDSSVFKSVNVPILAKWSDTKITDMSDKEHALKEPLRESTPSFLSTGMPLNQTAIISQNILQNSIVRNFKDDFSNNLPTPTILVKQEPSLSKIPTDYAEGVHTNVVVDNEIHRLEDIIDAAMIFARNEALKTPSKTSMVLDPEFVKKLGKFGDTDKANADGMA